MEKVILLGSSDRFSPQATKGLHAFMAGILILQGFFHFYDGYFDAIGSFRSILAIVLLLGGLYYLFLFFKGFSKSSGFAPKVRLSDEALEFKTGFFRDIVKIKWEDVRSIELKSYRLIFHLPNTEKSVSYTTTNYISQEIKRSIIEYADSKGVQVI
ncbi:MAG: hypothetical protein JXQ96_05160 [Cyclobacteriaceae bacterium]